MKLILLILTAASCAWSAAAPAPAPAPTTIPTRIPDPRYNCVVHSDCVIQNRGSCCGYFPVCANKAAVLNSADACFNNSGSCLGGIVRNCLCVSGGCASQHEFNGAGRGSAREQAIDAATGDCLTYAYSEGFVDADCKVIAIPFVGSTVETRGVVWRAAVDLECTRVYTYGGWVWT